MAKQRCEAWLDSHRCPSSSRTTSRYTRIRWPVAWSVRTESSSYSCLASPASAEVNSVAPVSVTRQ